MYEFVDILLQKRRYLIACFAVAFNLLLLSWLSSTLQAHRAIVSARIHAPYVNQMPQSDGPNAVTNALSQLPDDIGRFTNAVEVGVLKGTMSTATSIMTLDKALSHATYDAVIFSIRGVTWYVEGNARTTAAVFGFGGRVIGDTFLYTGRGIGAMFGFTGHMIGGTLGAGGHVVRGTFGFIGGITHVGDLIRPIDHTKAPTITQLRIQQAALIQKGTVDVSVAAATSGTGGACDAGDGNGGYPMGWCDASMDTMATVPYTNDQINRECTSYAFWYFTFIEGHADFKATGNAKYWAYTSNYPTHASPKVGAIAVETVGAYGHVAIVQALQGQKYAGQVVPAGYVLVSEMNYDWNGHFRYSYNPLSKFSAYIYP
ncbi:MAG: CHAP domain-containing protein [Candidatus Saccharimonadales bacterium]